MSQTVTTPTGEVLTKPPGCTCAYPTLIARNMCGHTPPCPVYEAWAKKHGSGTGTVIPDPVEPHARLLVAHLLECAPEAVPPEKVAIALSALRAALKVGERAGWDWATEEARRG